MPTPTVPFAVLAEGYTIEGERGGAPKATVPYICFWTDAFTFYNQVLGIITSGSIGPITFGQAYQFPPSPKMYAVRARIQPYGIDPASVPTAFPKLGLAPGEYWKYAKVSVDFEIPPYIQSQQDDPGNNNQLDPENPLTLCEQSLDIGGHKQTIKQAQLIFDDNTKATQDIAITVPEVKLVLTFPRVPYLPWQIVQTYVGSVNDQTVLQCAKGTLLFEGSQTKMTATTQGTIGQSVQLMFSYQNQDWNTGLKIDGTPALMSYTYGGAGSKRLYPYKDLTKLFLTYDPE